MKIGVFDSGIGGLSVANAIKKALPNDEIIFRNDAQHLPYATKTANEILAYCLPVLQSFIADDVSCIVIACNTVSTNLIEQLRELLPVPLVATEPMVKPAAEQSVSKIITVCATPLTLSSSRYQQLKQQYAQGITVIEPNCSDWSLLIEHSAISDKHIREVIEPTLDSGADQIVLGCTHYHWIEQQIKQIAASRATVLQPEQAVIAQLQQVLANL